MRKINISAVSYLNTSLFIYGIKNTDIINSINLSLDIPSDCAKKLVNNKVDIGLTPVIILNELENSRIISNYCIGATGKVKSVLLVSNSPVEKIKKIFLDHHSKTSIILAQVLASKLWDVNINWIYLTDQFDYYSLQKDEGAVIIGDKTFEYEKYFEFKYDLAEEWTKFTKLPFVFAAWVANKKINDDFISKFNASLKHGIDNIDKAIMNFSHHNVFNVNIKEYLTKNISFDLDEYKKKGLDLFLKYAIEMKKLK